MIAKNIPEWAVIIAIFGCFVVPVITYKLGRISGRLQASAEFQGKLLALMTKLGMTKEEEKRG